MTHEELDRLLAGAEGGTLTMRGPHGIMEIHFSPDELRNPALMRRAVLEQGGWRMPSYDQGAHDALVRLMFAFATARERGVSLAA